MKRKKNASGKKAKDRLTYTACSNVPGSSWITLQGEEI